MTYVDARALLTRGLHDVNGNLSVMGITTGGRWARTTLPPISIGGHDAKDYILMPSVRKRESLAAYSQSAVCSFTLKDPPFRPVPDMEVVFQIPTGTRWFAGRIANRPIRTPGKVNGQAVAFYDITCRDYKGATDLSRRLVVQTFRAGAGDSLVPTDMKVWLKPETLEDDYADNEQMGAAGWSDSSGEGNDFGDPDGLSLYHKPRVRYDAANGLPAVDFGPHILDYLGNTMNPSSNFLENRTLALTANAATVFIIGKRHAGTPATIGGVSNKYGRFLTMLRGGSNEINGTDAWVPAIFAAERDPAWDFAYGATPAPYIANYRDYAKSYQYPAAYDQWNNICSVIDGASMRLNVDFVDYAPVATDVTAIAPNIYRLGLGADGNTQLYGMIAEVIIYDRVLSAEEEGYVRQYLADKYGLTGAANIPIGCRDYTLHGIADFLINNWANKDIHGRTIDSFVNGFAEGGTEIKAIQFPYMSVAECIDALARKVNARWFVDYNKNVKGFFTNTGAFPQILDQNYTNFQGESFTWDYDSSQIRNEVYITGATKTELRSHTFVTANGNTIYPLPGYDIKRKSDVLSITKDGTPIESSAIGTDRIDAAGSAEIYVNADDDLLRLDAYPGDGVTYVVEFNSAEPITVVTRDEDAQRWLLNVTGMDGTRAYRAPPDASLDSQEAAELAGNAILAADAYPRFTGSIPYIHSDPVPHLGEELAIDFTPAAGFDVLPPEMTDLDGTPLKKNVLINSIESQIVGDWEEDPEWWAVHNLGFGAEPVGLHQILAQLMEDASKTAPLDTETLQQIASFRDEIAVEDTAPTTTMQDKVARFSPGAADRRFDFGEFS